MIERNGKRKRKSRSRQYLSLGPRLGDRRINGRESHLTMLISRQDPKSQCVISSWTI